ncbi:hypothetical protein ILYODFUR_005074 [Ilyodon furcidens]|uniref:Uncharacterized protein n=1 Tax=Ilyodon furcidens TaxID=33524 RepID=A0ABV0SXF0_9TELE
MTAISLHKHLNKFAIRSPTMVKVSGCWDGLPYAWISEESVEFFERMNAILQKQKNMMRAAQAECQIGPCTMPPPQEHVDQALISERVSRTELNLLYEEAVYTVVNRVGMPAPEHVKSDDELFAYLLKVFDMGDEEHDIILQKVQESKVEDIELEPGLEEQHCTGKEDRLMEMRNTCYPPHRRILMLSSGE